MSRRYSFDSDPSERAPLDYYSNHSYPNAYTSPSSQPSQPSSSPRRYQPQLEPELEPQPEPLYQDHPPSQYQNQKPRHHSPTRTGAPIRPGAHPDSAFDRLRQNRRQGGSPGRSAAAVGAGIGAVAGGTYALADSSPSRPTNITPGADNFSEAASGGIPGLAMNVAERNARESGLGAMRGAQQYQQQPPYSSPPAYQRSQPSQPPYDGHRGYGYGYDQGYDGSQRYGSYDHASGSSPHLTPSAASGASGASGAAGAAAISIGSGTPRRSVHSYASDPFRDPQMAYGPRMDLGMGQFNPNDIDDDGDEGLDYRRSARNSMLSLGNSSHRGNGGTAGAAAAVGGPAAVGGVIGGLMGRNRNSGVNYDPVQNNTGSSYQLGGAGENDIAARAEKSEWISKQNSSRKKWKWCLGIFIALIIAGGIAGGVVGGLLGNKDKGNGDGQSASDDAAANGDLDINSSEIKSLMNNPDLHKVFPGVDYTPINVQFPDCLKNPPSQNNVTRDVAVLSQLTNTIRLYGTDCNQTEMTIHALDRLKLQDEIKIWLGVWQDSNDTTNKRQISKMWNILDEYGDKPFKGLIVGNEILFREEMTAQELGNLLETIRSNLTDHGWNLPVATSDLGDNWDSSLAQISDYIMGNIHPFFAGVNAKEAASWTWSFWHNKASSFFKSDNSKNVISEIGWPSKGGTNCGSDSVTDCPNGSVAGIDELNTLMEDWVCQALANGTNYFWFEMFDEPWKISFNEPGKEWEDQWGLMDVNRKLKNGVKIPDCGGKTV
ncbi:glycoside hydrolase family 17 protein [Biscogniauxia marginata]|nr:glycoside hydrolase family 17 protein [Biscogniauxia marginata]